MKSLQHNRIARSVWKAVVPAFLFITVFLWGVVLARYSFCQMEALGLFLLTPDYFRELFTSPLPISHLLSDFLTQSFRFSMAGPAALAIVLLLIYLMLRSSNRFYGEMGGVFASLVCCVLWIFSARGADFVIPSASLIAAVLIFALTRLFSGRKGREKRRTTGWTFFAEIGLIAAASLVVSLDKKVISNEKWAQVEFFAYHSQWDKLLDVATVEAVEADHDLIPFALLALGGKDLLGERMFEYPVEGSQDLDTEGVYTRRGYYFGSLLYNCLGCPNEAIHNVFQCADALPHGMSFRTLRQLVKYNYDSGNFTLAGKYCFILSKSCFNSGFVSSYRDLIKERTISAEDSVTDNSEAEPESIPDADSADVKGAGVTPAAESTLPPLPGDSKSDEPQIKGKNSRQRNCSHASSVIDHSKRLDLINLFRMGISSRMIVERILCYQLAEGDLESFRANMQLFIPYYRDIPRHFDEALDMTPVTPEHGENLYLKYVERMNAAVNQ